MNQRDEAQLQRDLQHCRQQCEALRERLPDWQLEGLSIVDQLLDDAEDAIDSDQLPRANDFLLQAEVNYLFCDRQSADAQAKLAKVREAMAGPLRLSIDQLLK